MVDPVGYLPRVDLSQNPKGHIIILPARTAPGSDLHVRFEALAHDFFVEHYWAWIERVCQNDTAARDLEAGVVTKSLDASHLPESDCLAAQWRKALLDARSAQTLQASTEIMFGDLIESQVMEEVSQPPEVYWTKYARWLGLSGIEEVFTTSRGYIGVCSAGVEEGDVVCVLHGVTVPIVIRPSSKQGEFVLVGDCFVEGLMNGEAIELVETGELEEHILTLV